MKEKTTLDIMALKHSMKHGRHWKEAAFEDYKEGWMECLKVSLAITSMRSALDLCLLTLEHAKALGYLGEGGTLVLANECIEKIISASKKYKEESNE